MATIKPFKGIVYNPKKIKHIKDVVAPPYDIISKSIQGALYLRDPHNVVRLTLGKIKKSDGLQNNRYTRAKRFFESWLKNHILIQDKEDSLYVYSQRYREADKEKMRIGFIGLIRLNRDKKNILSHENTLLQPKLDRLALIRSVRTNLEPIFLLYEDNGHAVLNILKRCCLKNRPVIDIEIDDVRHRVYRLDGRNAINRIIHLMRPKEAFIADGHHRYEVSLTYSIEMQERLAPQALRRNSKFVMAYFVESDERALTILPSHRLVKDLGILKKDDVKKRLEEFFDIDRANDLDSLILRLKGHAKSHALGFYLGSGNFYIMKLKDSKNLDLFIKNNSKDWKRLDVTILHLFILEYVLGIRDDDENVLFVKDEIGAVRAVDSKKFELAFFLNPTKVSQVKRIARLGERMPRKATYFYPKPLSGLVMNKLY